MSLKLNTLYDENQAHWEIELIGEVDIHSKGMLKEKLTALNEEKQSNFIFKCNNLEYIDSTGLGVLIGFYKNVKVNDKSVCFENLKPSISKIFSLTGLDKIFSIR